jgi:GT2 family glycosyltransferase
MKIALCLPVHGDTKALFTLSLVGLVSETLKSRPEIEFQGHLKHGCSRIELAREELAELSLGAGADWLLWLDDDHVFPPDALLRLLAHDRPFVGCNYRKRIAGEVVSASGRIVRRITQQDKIAGIDAKASGVDPVDLVGFGLVLIKADVFRRVRRPWFKFEAMGEDGYFCEQAIKAGFQPHVDHALSMEVGHIAETVLRFPG